MIEVGILLIVLMRRFGRDLSGLSYEWLDTAIVHGEKKRGRWWWTVRLSFFFLLAVAIYAPVATHCSFLGKYYAELAQNPFAFDSSNPVSYRLLTPLVSYFLGLRGHAIIITNLVISAVMIGVVFAYFRRTAPRPGDAFLAATAMAFSLVVLTSIHCGGYCDILTYLIIFLMWQWRQKRVVFYLLFLLGLVNRESIAFLIPWFVFVSFEGDRRKGLVLLDLLIGLGVTLGAYYLYRIWIDSQMQVTYSSEYYLGHFLNDPWKHFRATFSYQSLGLFSVYKLLWAIPCLAVVGWWRERQYRDILGMILLLVCAGAQLLVAEDTSRMFTLSFMVVPVALEYLFKTNYLNFRRWAFILILFNLMIPQVYTAGTKVEVWSSLSAHLISQLL